VRKWTTHVFKKNAEWDIYEPYLADRQWQTQNKGTFRAICQPFSESLTIVHAGNRHYLETETFQACSISLKHSISNQAFLQPDIMRSQGEY
jgi:hypothetical protein